MMEGLKKRTRKAFGIRKKEKDNDSTGSPDREGGSQKKTNGAPNGFYGDIDWERYNSPEVDDEGYSIRPGEESDDGATTTRKSPFFSSDESEEEEDHRKKFKIKIKPLPADRVVAVPSVDELKASIGNIALSPSPLRSPRRSPALKRNTSSEEIARPRRTVPPVAPPVAPAVAPPVAPAVAPAVAPPVAPAVAPAAPQPSSRQQTPVSEDATALFGPPLDTDFGEPKAEVVLSDAWPTPPSESFPTGTPPPLPPKNVPASPVSTGPAPTEGADGDSSSRRPSLVDLDNIFGPEEAAAGVEEAADSWVCFSEEPPDRPPLPEEPAPPPPEEPAGPPPPDEPARPPPPEEPAPPLPTSPLPKEEQAPALPTSPPPAEEPSAPPATPATPAPPAPPAPSTPEDRISLPSPPPPSAPKELASPPASSSPPLHPAAPSASSPPAEEPAPLLLPAEEEHLKNTDATKPKEVGGEGLSSPSGGDQGSRTTPPPPPPPSYRAVMSSPGPGSGAGGSSSGSSSPVRPSTPSSAGPAPPPPPPRPPSRPKLPPGKPSVGDASRPFSPPVHSASPPPVAPLARAESTSSISSTNSLSAATTPTVGKELSLSVSENDQPSLVWFDRGKFYLTFEGCSRGPSPLTMGAQDTLPVAAAFTETVNAFFKGADPSNDTTTQPKADCKDFWVNMPNLISHLKKVAEQKPQATYYNVDMLKYQVSTNGLQSLPLNLAVSWRCEPSSTDLRIDYKYNGEAMTTASALNNVQFLVPVDGGVSKLQAVLPPAAWNSEQQRILWKIPDISLKSENGGVGSLLARFQLTGGPSKPAPLVVQFTSEGSTLSGCDIQLSGPGYRFSLVKKRFAAGKYLADH